MNDQQQTPTDLQTYLTTHGITAELLPDLGHTPTVPAAAAVLGVETDQIIKTLLFLVERGGEESGQPTAIVVISHGERRVSSKLLAAHFGLPKGRVRLASPAIVLDLLGYPAGGVPPLGHKTPLPVILDAAVVSAAERFGGQVYGGGGDDHTMLRIHLDELRRVIQPEIVAVS